MSLRKERPDAGRRGLGAAHRRGILVGGAVALATLTAGGIGAADGVEGPGDRIRTSAAEGWGWARPLPVEPSPVADAAMAGDREAVRALIRSGADVDAAQGDGMTALHWAAERGDPDLTRLLLEAGARGTVVTRLGGYTPLHLAARAGAGPVVRLLVEGGAPADRAADNGTTPLHFAAASGSVEAVEVLLAAGAEVDATESAWQQTPLIFAASWGHAGVVRLLLAAGADGSRTTRVVDIPARSAADAAAGRRRTEVLEAFREADGGDGSWRPTPAQVQAAIAAGQEVQREAEARAASAGPEEPTGVEGEVLGYPQMVGTQGGLSPLLHAVREGHHEAVAALLDGGVDIEQVSAGDGTSPLLMAVLNGHLDLATVLLERGADPNVASRAGAAPLYATVNVQWAPKSRYPQPRAHEQQRTDYLQLMAALLEAGADPNARLDQHLWYMSYTFDLLSVDTRGATPFWRAAYAADVEAMRLLVAHGADPHVPTLKPAERRRRAGPEGDVDPSGLPPVPVGGPGVWPIHAASGVGYGEGYAANAHRHAPDGWLPAVRYLVEELGADVNARDHNGYNAVHHAAARGDNELIRYLVEQGADVTAVSRRGQTTVDMANGPVQRISPFPETIELLEGLGAVNNHRCLSC